MQIRNTSMQKLLLLLLLTVAIFCSPVVHADTVRTQTIEIEEGWNAVYLEVGPAEPEPATVFEETPIDIAAAYLTPDSSAQFVINPGADLFRQTGWAVWYAGDRPDSFLKTLHAILGQQAYLIHSKAAFTWRVTGTVEKAEANWQPDAYNFVGFSVDAVAAPTFSQFFAGSEAHDQGRIYRLVNGAWKKVTVPDGENMRSGEAFWVYCDGSSDYPGPLGVETTSRFGVMALSAGAELVLRNETPHPVTPTLEHVASGTNSVPLAVIIQAVSATNDPIKQVAAAFPDGNWTQDLPALEAGTALRVPLTARVEDMTEVIHASLLKISTDLGTEVWIPVVGIRESSGE